MRGFFIVLFTPLARCLGGIHPIVITCIALVTGVLAGLAFFFTNYDHGFYLAAGLFVTISGVADSLDGIVARMYGRTTKTGDFLDHFCDRITELAIFIGLSFSLNTEPILGLLVTVFWMLHSYVGAQIKASFSEKYHGWAGKAEGFVGLIIFSCFSGLFPGFTRPPFLLHVSLTNIFFAIIGIITTIFFVHRMQCAVGLMATEMNRKTR